MTSTSSPVDIEQIPSKSRLVFGGTILVVGQLSPLLVPLIAIANLSTGWKATLSGLVLLGIPELSLLVAVAILGKSGFNFIKSCIFRFFKKHAPPDTVSPFRYYFGLTLFLVPFFFGWISPYLSHMLPVSETFRISTAIAGDLILLISLFVLGGDFWDKLRSLFVYRAKVQTQNVTQGQQTEQTQL